jgi:hypothetical protein
MSGVRGAVAYLALVFVGAMAATVLARLLTGGINTRGLLHGRRRDGTSYLSAERVQLLIFTVWAALSYLLTAAGNRGSGRLPDVPTTTLAALGVSHAVYLGGKAYSMLFARTVKREE